VAEKMASDKTLALLGKIKSKQWKAMGETVIGLKELVEMGGVGILGHLEESLTLEMGKLFSPLQNEINDALTEALSPIMPYITTVMNELTVWFKLAVESWKAIFTGQWDDVLKDITKLITSNMDDTQIQTLNKITGFLYDIRVSWERGWKKLGKKWEDFWRSLGWK